MKTIHIVAISLVCFTITNALIPNNLIIEFLNYKQIKFATFIHCWSNHDVASLRYLLGENYVRTYFITVDTFIDKYVEYNKTYYNVIFYETYGYVLDLNCKRIDEFFKLDLEFNYYRSRFYNLYKWLLIGNEEFDNEDLILARLGNVPFRLDSDISLAVPREFDLNYVIYDLHNPGYRYNATLKLNQVVGFVNGSFEVMNELRLYERRKNMAGLTISAVLVISQSTSLPTVQYLEDRSTKYADPVNKCTWAIFMGALEIHRFNFSLIITDKWYGDDDDGGISDGMIRTIFTKEADVSYTSAIITPLRIAVIDYIGEYYHFGTCFVYRNPTALGRIRNQFFNPFASSTWIVCALFLILLSLVMRLTFYVRDYYDDGEESEDDSPWSSAWLNTLGAFCQQDIETDADNITGRIIVLSLMICSLVLYNYYTSSIVSDLINSQTQAFTTIAQLVSSNLVLGMLDLTYIRTLFATTTNPVEKSLDAKKQYVDIDEGVLLIKKGGAAYHAEPSSLYPLIGKQLEANEICDLYEIYMFKLEYLYAPIPKRSQYKEMLQMSMRMMRERGIVKRERRIWETSKPPCLGGANILQIELEQAAPALLLLLFGVVLALCIWILEVLQYRRNCIVKKFKYNTIFSTFTGKGLP